MHAMTRRLVRAVLAAGLALAPLAATAQQGGLFAPAILVNERVITNFELDQRARMLEVLNAPGDPRQQLIDDRLRLQAAADAGIVPSEQAVEDGMTEFAARGGLEVQEFLAVLASQGVAEQTFRDFVRAGVAWRDLVQSRFAGAGAPSEDEIDRALSSRGGGSSVRVLLSEIIMPLTPANATEVRARAARIAELESTDAFSAQARRFSATASRDQGGRLPWRALDELPPPLQPLVLGLKPGEVTDPLPIEGAVALFQLRAIEEVGYTPPPVAALDYAVYYMAGGRSAETLARARAIAARVDRCDDLYGVAQGQPPEVLERGTLPVEQVPTDIAFELSKLDPGEVSTALTRADGQTLLFLMLCGRTPAIDGEIDRQQFALGLRNQRLSAQAEGFLSQLRAEARIVEQ